jgi:Flp pilus assembly protein TadD
MKSPFCIRTSLVLAAIFLAGCHSEPHAVKTAEYVAVQVCAGCHASIASTYSKTGMARAFDTPSSANVPLVAGAKNDFYQAPSRTHFQMLRRGNDFFQRRWQVDPNGRETNVDELKIAYVMGSGNHSRSYLHRTTRDTLIELPLAWYPQGGGTWAMNPGFAGDHLFTRRKVGYGCMFCHNAYPKVPAHSEEPVYPGQLPTGIDCQRCHGPGSVHVEAARTGAKSLAGTIVNPARLSPERQMEVCMQCHLQTTAETFPSSLRRFGREPFSYTPSEALKDFQLYFDRAGGPRRDGRFEIVSSAYRLRQSQCFLKSAGKLVCETCHDPHNIPRGQEAISHYDSVCRSCHGAAIVALISSGTHPAAGDCAGCHMPKRHTDDVPLAIMTDHLIQRPQPVVKGVAESALYRGEVVPYYPAQPGKDDRLIVAAAQVINENNLAAGVPLLADEVAKVSPGAEAYIVLGDAYRHNGQPAQAAAAYEQAARKDPSSGRALRGWGAALKDSRDLEGAARVLQKAVRDMPEDPENWHELGLLDSETGRPAQAIVELRKAIQLDPDLASAYNNLGGDLALIGQMDEAEAAFREAVRIDPFSALAHLNLAKVVVANGRIAEAIIEAGHAVRLDPNMSEAQMVLEKLHAFQGKR